jgi:hypothetical protein
MITKEYVKREIDRMPDELVEKVHEFIKEISSQSNVKKGIDTYKLNGAFDEVDIRKEAYE